MNITCYTETLSADHKWRADSLGTNLQQFFTTVGLQMAGLLCMGAFKQSYPYSFGQKNFPRVCSPEIKEAWESRGAGVMGDRASHLTREQLSIKRAEMLIHNMEDCPGLIQEVTNILDRWPNADQYEPRKQRMVFWFSDGSGEHGDHLADSTVLTRDMFKKIIRGQRLNKSPSQQGLHPWQKI